jgi:hypothetical protein
MRKLIRWLHFPITKAVAEFIRVFAAAYGVTLLDKPIRRTGAAMPIDEVFKYIFLD